MEIPEKNSESYQAAYEKMKRWYRGLPDKKRYLEFVTAFLTIPVLLTVLLNNISNIQNQKPLPSVTPTPSVVTVTERIREPSPTPVTAITQSGTPSPTPDAQCKREIGPVAIIYPEEGQSTSDNPVCLDITRESGNYCAVVWSYRINGSSWSNYTDKTICMYGLTNGEKNLELRVKSIVSGEENILKRTFTVTGNPTPTPASESAQLQ